MKIWLNILGMMVMLLGPGFGYAADPLPVKKMKPAVRTTPLSQVRQTIPLEIIKPFLLNLHVLDKTTLRSAPTITGAKGRRVVMGNNDVIYANGLSDSVVQSYQVISDKGVVMTDPENPNQVLGYLLMSKGEAVVEQFGQPSRLRLQKTRREIVVGDKLLATDNVVLTDFNPKPATSKIKSRILHVFGGVHQIGKYSIVAIAGGHKAGLQAGDMLAVYRQGPRVKSTSKSRVIQLPDEQAGELMIFRPFAQISFAIVLSATDTMAVNDLVKNLS